MEKPAYDDHRYFPDGFFMQQHNPDVMPENHTHGHVEILLPLGCELIYETQAGACLAPDRHISVLWGQMPHRVSRVTGEGQIMIANLPLAELISWSMPETFLSQLFTGQLVTSLTPNPMDEHQFQRWLADFDRAESELIAVARMELQLRLRRQSIAGWRGQAASRPATAPRARTADRSSQHVHKMIRYMAEHYTQPVCIADVADAAKISKGYAMSAFQTSLGLSINSYLSQLRIHHAKAALIDSDDKVINIALDSGFGSLSRFYEVFQKQAGLTPHKFRRQYRKGAAMRDRLPDQHSV